MRGKLIDIVNGIFTLLQRLTSTRAGLIDHLNADIDSRAAAATAVSNAVLTPTRIGYLDNLAAGLLATVVNSIQSGYIDVDGATWTAGSGIDFRYSEVTVTSVNVSKSILIWQPATMVASGVPVISICRLFSATKLRASIQEDPGSAAIRGHWLLLELK